MTDPEAKRYLAFIDQLAMAVANPSLPCAAIATKINATIDAHRDVVERAIAAYAMGQRLPASAEKQMADRLGAAMAQLARCSSDKAVARAMLRLQDPSVAKELPAAADVRREIPPAQAAQFEAFIDALVTAVADAKGDCAKVAAAMRAVTATHRDALAAAQQAQASQYRLPPAVEARIATRAKAMGNSLSPCLSNPDVATAIRAFAPAERPNAASNRAATPSVAAPPRTP